MATRTVCVTMEFYVELEAEMVRNDYGVARSPVWYEPENIEVRRIMHEDKEYSEEEFAEKFGEKLAALVAEEASDDDNVEWEDD